MRYHLRKAAICGLWLAFVSTIAMSADADESPYEEKSKAEALYDEAKALMGANKFAEACPKLEESLIEEPNVRMSFNLAFCYESAGLFDDALALYDETVDGAKKEGWREEEVRARAQAQAKALRDRLSTMILQLRAGDAGIPDLKIFVDGHELHRDSSLRIPTRVEVGKHVVEVKARGRESSRTEVVAPPPPERLLVTVTPGAFAPQGIFAEESDPSQPTNAPVQPPKAGMTGIQIFGGVWGSLGVLAFVTGVVLPKTVHPASESIQTMQVASAGLVGAGLASVLGGSLLMIFAKSAPSTEGNSSTSPQVAVVPAMAPGFGGAFVSVRF